MAAWGAGEEKKDGDHGDVGKDGARGCVREDFLADEFTQGGLVFAYVLHDLLVHPRLDALLNEALCAIAREENISCWDFKLPNNNNNNKNNKNNNNE